MKNPNPNSINAASEQWLDTPLSHVYFVSSISYLPQTNQQHTNNPKSIRRARTRHV